MLCKSIRIPGGSIIDIGSDNGWMYIDNTYDDAKISIAKTGWEVNFDVREG